MKFELPDPISFRTNRTKLMFVDVFIKNRNSIILELKILIFGAFGFIFWYKECDFEILMKRAPNSSYYFQNSSYDVNFMYSYDFQRFSMFTMYTSYTLYTYEFETEPECQSANWRTNEKAPYEILNCPGRLEKHSATYLKEWCLLKTFEQK